MGPYMYVFNTIPDYYNRMAIFLAKMIHDGSYDAHFIDNKGMIVYNPIDDDRYKYYFANRHKHKDSKGRYIPAVNDEKYNKQRNLYLWLQGQLNIERVGQTDHEDFTEDDMVDQAYSEKERTSLKSFTDTAYGYYDKDSQSQLHNVAFGVIFLQFLQFWPGKMQMWFGKPVSADKSTIGKLVQKTEENEKGELVKLWRKPVYGDKDDPDRITDFDHTTENTGDPLYDWEGSPQEGLYYSVVFTIQEILNINKDENLSEADRRARIARAKFAMADSILMLIFFGMLTAFIRGWIAENGTSGLEGNTMRLAEEVSKRVLSESNVYENTFGALRTEPAFWSYSTRIAQSVNDVMFNDGNIKNLAKNVKMFELLNKDFLYGE